MHRYKNIAITGRKDAGKSTLARWLLAQLDLPYAGFQTTQYAITGQGPLYQMEDFLTGASMPISHLLPEGIRGIPQAFDTFGTQVVTNALSSFSPALLLDEIGRFEQNSPAFLNCLRSALDSPKAVIAVLKKEPLPHIQAIRKRADTLVVDLDIFSQEQAREILRQWMEIS